MFARNPDRKFDTVAERELAKNRLHVVLNGLFRDAKAPGNPSIGIAACHESGYFVFPLSKRLHEAKLSSEGPGNSNQE